MPKAGRHERGNTGSQALGLDSMAANSFYLELYEKYDEELRQLAHRLRTQYHRMQDSGHGAVFGDVEGELVYILVREKQPEIAFEISPNTGWSTNYILAALTANQKGILHSFEILPSFRGRPIEEVIRGNQHRDWDQQRLVIHVGDAQDLVPSVTGTIDFLLIDSCHLDWFAEWYIGSVFPRVDGPVMIQDIAFVDEPESSSESERLWAWAESEHIELKLMGSVESALESAGARAGYAERRGLRSNAVLCWLPAKERADPPVLDESIGAWINQADDAITMGDCPAADSLLNRSVTKLLRQSTRVNRHRHFCTAGRCYARMGEAREAQRCFQRALGLVMQADTEQRFKGLEELLPIFVIQHHWRLAVQTALAIVLDRKAGSRLASLARHSAPFLVRRLRRTR